MSNTNVKSRWVDGNLVFYDKDMNIIATYDGTNRKISFPSGSTLEIASGATMSIADGSLETPDVALAEGNILVGDADGQGSALNAKADGKILVGNGTTITSVAVSGDATLANDGTLTVEDEAITPAKTSGIAMLYNLGAPELSATDTIVAVEEMDNKEYTLAGDPDIPRNITVTRTVAGGEDTPGIVTINGTNIDDEVISEEIIPGANGVTVAGTKAFKTVTSVVGTGWSITDGADSIEVGYGDLLGCPVATDDADNIMLGMLGGTVVAHNASVDVSGAVELVTVDMSSGTYNGSKSALIWQKN